MNKKKALTFGELPNGKKSKRDYGGELALLSARPGSWAMIPGPWKTSQTAQSAGFGLLRYASEHFVLIQFSTRNHALWARVVPAKEVKP